MGNQPGKYFEDTHQIEMLRFEVRGLMRSVDGAYEKCVAPGLREDSSSSVELTDYERRCTLEYIRTRSAYQKSFRRQFETKVKALMEEKMKSDSNKADALGKA
eukprot:TRINITY_DN1877_c1_g2_i3.p2 TRINITY_DN1877_c1_g2~~TRINITY_DN1877_c1_g2_i3.p2  ORF type:complete len:120 (+),score=39.92 TRINITY_DN1877_c1_g2_i3:52-360(+)